MGTTSEAESLTRMASEAEENYQRGVALLSTGQHREGFEHLSRAYLERPDNALFKSWYAVALARVSGESQGAVELGESAARQDMEDPILFLNLAQIHEVCGQRGEAIRCLWRVLRISPGNEEARERLASMGVRRPPVVPFLPRRHMANRMMGRLRAMLSGTEHAGSRYWGPPASPSLR